MGKTFYAKLAAQNLKKNSKFYIPYFTASSITAAMFYIISFLTHNPALEDHQTQTVFLQMGTYIIGIFAVIILLYINSFLMKRRQKEIGLYNVLGMEKRHIGRIFGWETVYSYGITMLCGFAVGILLSKLFLLLLYKLTNVTDAFTFFIDSTGIAETLILFAGIFLLLLVLNRIKIHLSNPVELLRGGNVGEKEPKANWFLAVLGLVLTGIGYYIALTTNEPIAAIRNFFLAVVLVIIGTYFLFIAGTVALLKLLKKHKKFYYKTNHFTAVSGLLYRMKQNAAGLASICILATMVIVMISATVSLNIGANDVLDTQYPYDYTVTMYNTPKVDGKSFQKKFNNAIAFDSLSKTIRDEHGTSYLCVEAFPTANGNYRLPTSTDEYYSSNSTHFYFLTAKSYQEAMGVPLSLQNGEVAVYDANRASLPTSFSILGQTFQITKQLSRTPFSKSAALGDTYIIAVKDEQVLDTLQKGQEKALHGFVDASRTAYAYSLSFNTDGTPEQKINLMHSAFSSISEITQSNNGTVSSSVDCRQDAENAFHEMYGGMLFLGLFLSILFLMATVLIIYYKQISEGYEDADRYRIMRQVGMSRAEVKKSIHSQILIVFFLPLLVAVIHMAGVFRFMTLLLKAMYLGNVPLFALCTVCTVAVFAIVYTLVYSATTRTYYKIVSPAKQA
ncbi:MULTISPECIES: ABC transporter permease [Caproicibacterium]|uniref:ABC transporter permease n=1 Tax=Caproicibacterium argilliputei TaxID=3030016 RepID=A0AA97D9W5_9FIRM|nr:ABC transporter permease [Caproicibacterium argilliputei]WOC31703.1 ABC transporter permease [Caproicibacterium argilliputei]